MKRLLELNEIFQVALDSLRANKMRSILTMLGIIIGVGAVITMTALGEGAQKAVAERIQSLGSNLITVFPGAMRGGGGVMFSMGSRITLEEKDVSSILEKAETVSDVVGEFSRNAQVKYLNNNWNTRVVGATPNYSSVRNFRVVNGRFFNPRENQGRERVAVLGNEVKKQLFGEKDPVGEIIKVSRINFEVIGVFEEKGAMGWQNVDDQVLIPLMTAQRRVFGVDFLSNITVQVASADQMEMAFLEVEKILRRQHRLRPDQDNDFNMRSQTDILTTFQETQKTFTYLLAGIAAVSLLVGGIGIMNIMLVSVTERTREIGVRKAIGAQKSDILIQFLIEATVLSLAGGILGILFGFAGSYGLSGLAGWKTVISVDSILLSFLFAGAVGVFFGYYPARRAALLNPIDALRYE